MSANAGPYVVADLGSNYGAPLQAETLPGSGEVICACRNHRAHCLFGRGHTWQTWYSQGRRVRGEDDFMCSCGSVCLDAPRGSRKGSRTP